jgi:hypothetical protein
MTGDLRPYHCNGPLTDDEAMAGTVSTSSGPRVRWRRTWVIAAGLAIAVLVIVGIVVFSGGGSSSTSALADQQLASVQRVCEQWSGSSAPMLGTSSASLACTTMTHWMTQQLRDGRMTGPMMWGSATAMGGACRLWMDTDSRSSVSGRASPGWCNEMVDWMKQHIANWDDWMMHGNMMGG